MAPRNSSQKKVTKSTSKFASKLVGSVIEDSIQSIINSTTHNPKTVGKWMSKMKLSLLKKISNASKIAFVSNGSTTAKLRNQILNLREQIKQQRESVRETAIQIMKQSKLSDIEFQSANNDSSDVYNVGRFDIQVKKIHESFGQVTQKLASNLADIPECIKTFESSLNATNSGWKQSSQLIAQSVSSKTRSNTRISPGSQSSNKLPIEVLNNHLGTN